MSMGEELLDYCEHLQHFSADAPLGFCKKGDAPTLSFFDEDLDYDKPVAVHADTEEGFKHQLSQTRVQLPVTESCRGKAAVRYRAHCRRPCHCPRSEQRLVVRGGEGGADL